MTKHEKELVDSLVDLQKMSHDAMELSTKAFLLAGYLERLYYGHILSKQRKKQVKANKPK